MSNIPKIADRIKELSYTTGTNDFLLAGSVTGFGSFASKFQNNDVVFYAATDGTDYEVGSGVFSGSTLTRFATASSNSNNLVSFSAGVKEVYSTYPATHAVMSTSGVTPFSLPQSSGIAFWVSDKTIGYDSNFTWNNTNNKLGINQPNPSFSIDVGGTPELSSIQSSGIRTGVSGIFFPSGTSVPGYSGGRQIEHFERNVLGDANIQSVIELSGVVDQYLWFKKQSAGLIFAGPPSGCGAGCSDAMPSFRTLVYDDIPQLAEVSGILNADIIASGTIVVNDLNTASGALNSDMIASGTIVVNDLNTASGALDSYITNVSGILVDTPSGVHSYLARWSDDDTLGTSVVYESGGYVGIGTDTPDSPLEVFSSGASSSGLFYFKAGNAFDAIGAYVSNDNQHGDSFYALGVNGSDVNWVMMNDASGRGTDDTLVFMKGNISSNDVKLAITNSGDVGIGTDVPLHKVDISGTMRANSGIFGTSVTSSIEMPLEVIGSGRFTYPNGMCGLHVVDDGGGHSGIHIGDCALGGNQAFAGMKHSQYNMTTDYMIVSDGSDTYISAKDTGSVYLRPGGNAGEGGITISDVGAGAVGTVFNEAGADRDIRMEGASFTNMFRLDASTDRIGIGTATPSHTLSVSGAINADQIYNSGTLMTDQLITGPTTIATSDTTGTAGQMHWDTNYIYVCVATNTWKRVLLSTW